MRKVEEDRLAAQRLRAAGHSVQRTAKLVGRSEDFVRKWVARGEEGRGYEDAQRPGAARKVPDELLPKVKRILKRKREGGSANAAKILKREHDIDVSSQTIRNYAHEHGLKAYMRPKKPRLSGGDKPARVKFARSHLRKGGLRDVWWTDEKAFTFHNDANWIWAECRDQVPPRERDVVEKTVRVWGGISRWGLSELFFIKPYWKSTDYSDFLKKKAIPDLIKKSDSDFIFEHDGDGAHRGKIVQKTFEELDVKLLKGFPAHSPDIPPIENVWRITIEGLNNRNFKTMDGFKRALKEEWAKISAEKVSSLMKSVPSRLKEIVRKEGGITHY